MSDLWWTWALFGMEIVGVGGSLLVGRGRWWGWLVIAGHSVPWFVYSISHGKPGFVAMSLLWWTAHGYNGWRWWSRRRSLGALG
jgi:hypothetical protein